MLSTWKATALAVLGIWCLSGVGCADSEANPGGSARDGQPVWGNAQLTLVSAEATRATVLWDPASDDRAVAGYRVYLNGVRWSTVDSGTRSVELTGLSEVTSYVVAIEVLDSVGQVGAERLTLAFETAAQDTVLSFPDGAELTVSWAGATPTVRWPSALPSGEVTAYQVYLNYLHVVSAGAQATDAVLPAWPAGEPVVVSVVAESGQSDLDARLDLWTTAADGMAPVFPPEAEALASKVGESTLRLGWDQANDNVGVVEYRVFEGGTLRRTLPADRTWADIDELVSYTAYRFEIVAVDAEGLTSQPLGVDVQTLDLTPPQFEPDAALLVQVVEDTLVVTIPEASDAGAGLGEFTVFVNHVPKATVAPGTDEAVISYGVGGHLWVQVAAVDTAGNVSTQGPSVWVDTNDTAPPLWLPDDLTTIDTVEATSVLLSWPAASDDVSVAAYEVRDEVGALWTVVTGEVLQVVLTGLQPSTGYSGTVAARDGAGNLSTPLPFAFETAEAPAPTWPEEVSVAVGGLSATGATLTWAPFEPLPWMAEVVVLVDGVESVSVPPDVGEAMLSGLQPATTYAVDMRVRADDGEMSGTGPSVDITTSALSAPEFGGGATLQVSEVTETSARLTWSAPVSANEVASYEARDSEGQVVLSVATPALTGVVTGLLPASSDVVEIVAIGAGGLESVDGPSAIVQTLDVTGPAFPVGALLSIDAVSETAAELSWTSAADASLGPVTYRVLVDGQSLVTTDETSAELTGLSPSTVYTVSVRAEDGSGNMTVGPSELLTTLSGGGVSTATVFAALDPHCGSCHGVGNQAMFGSLANFETYVVGDPSRIVPGDPDASPFVQFIEASGPAPLLQMPPAYAVTGTYADLVTAGEASLGIEAIRDWVTSLGGMP